MSEILEAEPSTDFPLDPLVERLDEWINANWHELHSLTEGVESALTRSRVEAARRLQRLLYEAGWAKFGWPKEVGGLGGSVLHRATIFDRLAAAGVPEPALFEHLEILGPPLIKYGHPGFVARVFPMLLSGDQAWAQGFSEPDAGSDLLGLRTTATVVEGGAIIQGRKIWTSWAAYSRWCLVIARTGSIESRHRGLSAFAVDLESKGVEVSRILQANAGDELAEVTFDDVFVPVDAFVGNLGSGFEVMLAVLGYERGIYPWYRQSILQSRLRTVANDLGSDFDDMLGSVVLDLFAVRAASTRAVASTALGQLPGPEAALGKLLLVRAEQELYDLIYAALGTKISLGSHRRATKLTHDYFFSSVTSVYGGSQQMQLTTIATKVLGLPR